MIIDGFEYPRISKRNARKLACKLADLFGYYDLRMLLAFFTSGGAEDGIWIPALHRTVFEDGFLYYRSGRLWRKPVRPKYLSAVVGYMSCNGLNHLGDALEHASRRRHRRMARAIERAMLDGYRYVDGIKSLEEALG